VKHTWAKYAFHIGFYSESEGNVLQFYWSKVLGIEGACRKGGKSIFTASYNLVTLQSITKLVVNTHARVQSPSLCLQFGVFSFALLT
jgi:hypothetical protein